MNFKILTLVAALFCTSCGGESPSNTAGGTTPSTPVPTPITPPKPITGVTQATAIATFNKPWAIKTLPDGRFLVTQRSNPGQLSLVTTDGVVTAVTGLPDNIGLLDVEPAPDFTRSRLIYISYMVRDTSAVRVGRGKDDATLFPERMVVSRAQLLEAYGTASLSTIWPVFTQDPTIVAFPGSGEPGGRIVFSPDGRYLFITSGDRQELDKDFLFSLDNNLGKTIRVFPDGTIPSDNPYVATVGAKPEIWSIGHRNHYGMAFTGDGRLWSSEMGPKGGDELNLLLPKRNYGWPAVSNGDTYTGEIIPDHALGDGYEAPKISWTPAIAPAGMVVYQGAEFADWSGDLLLTGLQSHGLIRVRPSGDTAQEVQRIDLGTRVRDIAIGRDGSLWVLTDGAAGELRRLTPVF